MIVLTLSYPLTTRTCTQVGFKTFLGVVPVVTNWSPRNDEFSLILDQNPLTDFVELPEDHPNLLFSNIMCGVVRGALEMVRSFIVCVWGGGSVASPDHFP